MQLIAGYSAYINHRWLRTSNYIQTGYKSIRSRPTPRRRQCSQTVPEGAPKARVQTPCGDRRQRVLVPGVSSCLVNIPGHGTGQGSATRKSARKNGCAPPAGHRRAGCRGRSSFARYEICRGAALSGAIVSVVPRRRGDFRGGRETAARVSLSHSMTALTRCRRSTSGCTSTRR